MNSVRVSMNQQVESSAAPCPIVNVVSHKSASNLLTHGVGTCKCQNEAFKQIGQRTSDRVVTTAHEMKRPCE
jgi:hypothetical protein